MLQYKSSLNIVMNGKYTNIDREMADNDKTFEFTSNFSQNVFWGTAHTDYLHSFIVILRFGGKWKFFVIVQKTHLIT